MRAALISLAGSEQAIAGRSIALRQFDFALAAGCTRVFGFGEPAWPEMTALGQAAERAGMRFQAVRDVRGLLGALPAGDELLVLAPGLLPESLDALKALASPAVLVLPAERGLAAGFERIDIEHASAGALVIPGGLLERLADLPPDSEPSSILLRIALQARIGKRRLPEGALVDGSWALAGEAGSAHVLTGRWLARHTPPAPRHAFTARVAQAVLEPLSLRLLARPRASLALGAASLAFQLLAVVLCGWVSAPAGFAVLALGLLSAEMADRLGALAAAPFGQPRSRWRWWRDALGDGALATCGALSIWGTLVHRLFPPIILGGVLRASGAVAWPNAAALLGDRLLLALVFAVAALFDRTEEAIMLAALAIVLCQVIRTEARSG